AGRISPPQHDRDGRIRRRSTPPAHGISRAQRTLVGHSRTTIRALGSQPIKYTPPHGRERVGRNAAAKAPPPQSRGRDDCDATRLIRADDNWPSILTATKARLESSP